jgi:hypothetical protein
MTSGASVFVWSCDAALTALQFCAQLVLQRKYLRYSEMTYNLSRIIKIAIFQALLLGKLRNLPELMIDVPRFLDLWGTRSRIRFRVMYKGQRGIFRPTTACRKRIPDPKIAFEHQIAQIVNGKAN